MAIYIEGHGGECCGRKHMYEFGNMGPTDREVQRVLNLLADVFNQYYDDDLDDEQEITYGDMCVEITLTHWQAIEVGRDGDSKGKTWDQILRGMGWSRVYSFTNPNTDNTVHVYLYSDNNRTDKYVGDLSAT